MADGRMGAKETRAHSKPQVQTIVETVDREVIVPQIQNVERIMEVRSTG